MPDDAEDFLPCRQDWGRILSTPNATIWSDEFDRMMRAYYDARASDYDSTYKRPERQQDLALISARLAPKFSQRRVLDVACGTGYWAGIFAPQARAVVGLDASATVLEYARSKNIERAEFHIADAYLPPRTLGTFDGAMLGFWWSHVPLNKLDAMLDRLHELLEPGARVIILDNRFVPGNSTPIAETDSDGNTWQVRPGINEIFHRVLKNYPTYGEMLERLGTRASSTHWWNLDYYWWFEYTVKSA